MIDQELQQQLMSQGSQLNEGSRVVQELVADKMKASIKKPRGRPKKDTPVQTRSTHPFVCEVEGCGKQFKREQDLKSHNTKIHSEPFICETPDCNTVLGNNEFKCPNCGVEYE